MPVFNLLVGIGAILALVFIGVFMSFAAVYIRAQVAGAPVSLTELISMKLQRVPVGLIVDNRVIAVKAGIPIRTDLLVAHFQAGGDVTMVVRALIAAERAGLPLDFHRAAAIDLATQHSGKMGFNEHR